MKISQRLRRHLSLVEVVVALAILTLAFTGSMSLYYSSATYSRSSAQRSEARTLALAELATLRRTLRTAPFLDGATDNRATLFTDVVTNDPNGAFVDAGGGATYTRTRVVTMSRGRLGNVTIVTTCFFSESLGEAALGLTGGLDLNADGTTGSVGTIAPADMWALPTTVSITWAPAEGQGGTETIAVSGVLY